MKAYSSHVFDVTLAAFCVFCGCTFLLILLGRRPFFATSTSDKCEDNAYGQTLKVIQSEKKIVIVDSHYMLHQ